MSSSENKKVLWINSCPSSMTYITEGFHYYLTKEHPEHNAEYHWLRLGDLERFKNNEDELSEDAKEVITEIELEEYDFETILNTIANYDVVIISGVLNREDLKAILNNDCKEISETFAIKILENLNKMENRPKTVIYTPYAELFDILNCYYEVYLRSERGNERIFCEHYLSIASSLFSASRSKELMNIIENAPRISEVKQNKDAALGAK